jgi:molybdate transport system regulatory protein
MPAEGMRCDYNRNQSAVQCQRNCVGIALSAAAFSQREFHMAELSIRIDFGPGRRVGPGKIALLEQIAMQGSIAAGGRALGMSYRRAWQLVDDINGIFATPVVAARTGGRAGGGAGLTPLGLALVAHYRSIEKAAAEAAQAQLQALHAELPVAARKKK